MEVEYKVIFETGYICNEDQTHYNPSLVYISVRHLSIHVQATEKETFVFIWELMSLLFESTKQRERGLKERKLSPSFLLVNVDWNINLILHLAYPPQKKPIEFHSHALFR